MAGIRADVEFEGVENLQRTLQRVVNLGENPAPLLDEWGAIIRASILERFDTGRGPGGIPWPQTKRQVRRAVDPDGPNKAKILVDTGDLQDSIRYEVRATEVEIGSDGLKNPMKALANQFGSDRSVPVRSHQRTINSAFGIPLPAPKSFIVGEYNRTNNLPARPFIGIDAQDREKLEERGMIFIRRLFDA